VLAVLLLPIAFVPLLGYAIAATRAASASEPDGPPRWSFSGRLISDGLWIALALAIVTAPFALALNPLAVAIARSGLTRAGDPMAQVYGHVIAFFVLALPWGVVLLLLMPHGTRRFASTGRARDLFDAAATIRDLRHDFATWNVAAAAMVTAWAVALACIGLLCLGVVPAIFYAILVSAHATAALNASGANPSAR
jgi:hypothetical protein